ncbi:hypothetical protein C4513_00060 [Morganella morganii]|nr:hypothetical protein [Morganella morganii]MQC09322.1 hypothetical protein [Morganella morganii]MQC13040.1 hypothetical protein [Morganella morganii]
MVKILLSALLLFYPLISPAVSDECQNIARRAGNQSAGSERHIFRYRLPAGPIFIPHRTAAVKVKIVF